MRIAKVEWSARWWWAARGHTTTYVTSRRHSALSARCFGLGLRRPDAVQGVIANETPMVFQAASGILPQIQGGTLRALGITSPQRSPLAPEIPTFAEQGFPGVVVEEHIALQGPAGLPPEIIRRANELARAAMMAADTRLRLATLAVLPMVTSPDDWPAYFAAENAKWRDMIRARNIRIQ